LKLKVGAITASYEGSVTFDNVDRDAHTATLDARGGETDGQGTASARVAASVEPADGGSRVTVDTELDVEGRAAQFGRGAMGTVAQRIIDQFARNLEAQVLRPADEPDTGSEPGEGSPGGRSAPTDDGSGSDDALDLLQLAGLPSLLKLPSAAALPVVFVIGLLIGVVLRGSRRSRPEIIVVAPPWYQGDPS
jgi:hypothetical protein